MSSRIIDFHTHFFPDRLFDAIWRWFEKNAWPIAYKHYADDLVKILKKEGVSRAVSLHYPHKKGMSEELNRWSFEFSRRHADFIIPFGSVHPDEPNVEEILETCFGEYGFHGLKIHCHVQKVSPDDPRMGPIYRACARHKKILLIHCGTGPRFPDKPEHGYGYDVRTVSGVARFRRALEKNPDVTFVVPHLGFEEIGEFLALADTFPNLFFDTAVVFSNLFHVDSRREWFEKQYDRILFGSDFPQIAYPWKTEREKILSFKLGRKIEEKIFFRNAISLLGLGRP